MEEDAINHHGFERKVPEFQKYSKESYTKKIYNVATFFGKSWQSQYLTTIIINLFLETKVVPVIVVLFTVIYWSYAISCYGL